MRCTRPPPQWDAFRLHIPSQRLSSTLLCRSALMQPLHSIKKQIGGKIQESPAVPVTPAHSQHVSVHESCSIYGTCRAKAAHHIFKKFSSCRYRSPIVKLTLPGYPCESGTTGASAKTRLSIQTDPPCPRCHDGAPFMLSFESRWATFGKLSLKYCRGAASEMGKLSNLQQAQDGCWTLPRQCLTQSACISPALPSKSCQAGEVSALLVISSRTTAREPVIARLKSLSDAFSALLQFTSCKLICRHQA